MFSLAGALLVGGIAPPVGVGGKRRQTAGDGFSGGDFQGITAGPSTAVNFDRRLK